MKNSIIILFAILFVIPSIGSAQSDLMRRLKDKAKSRADRRVDQGMEKGLDEVEGAVKDAGKEGNSKNETKTVTTTSANAKASKTDTTVTPQNLKSYSRFDFVPGEQVVYAEDFSQDEIGELPLKWGTNNRGETVTIESLPGKWMQLFNGSRFSSPALKKLPENFTVEMDMMLQYSGEGGYVFPELEIKLLQLHPSDTKAQAFLVNQDAANEVALVLIPSREEPETYLKSFTAGSKYFTNQPKGLKVSEVTGKPFHVSIWVQKERIRYWINGEKVYDIPQGVPEKVAFNRIGFSLESSLYTPEQFGVFISNIKIAQGAPDLRSKLLTEGKWATSGILFDVNSDRIKPESYGVIKEIATVLKDNPMVKVKVVGHTDSDGDAAKNLELSKRRAAAVKAVLESEFKIEASRLQTDGLGESKPVADNTTKEGKLQNRRVEFIKL